MKNTKKKQPAKKLCVCPYCDVELVAAQFPFCNSCGSVVQHCVVCEITVLDKKATKCPQCGGPLSKGVSKKGNKK